MEIFQTLSTIDFWFGLATGALLCDVAKHVFKQKFLDATSTDEEEL